MMDIKKVVDLLPESVKYDTMNFEDVMLKDGRPAMRVTTETICGGAIMFTVGYMCISMPLIMMKG